MVVINFETKTHTAGLGREPILGGNQIVISLAWEEFLCAPSEAYKINSAHESADAQLICFDWISDKILRINRAPPDFRRVCDGWYSLKFMFKRNTVTFVYFKISEYELNSSNVIFTETRIYRDRSTNFGHNPSRYSWSE